MILQNGMPTCERRCNKDYTVYSRNKDFPETTIDAEPKSSKILLDNLCTLD